MRSRLIYVVLFIAIVIGVIYSPLIPYLLKDFIIFRAEKTLDLTIVFGKARFEFPAKLTVSDLKALDKNGTAFTAKRAYFQLDASKIIKANAVLNCELRNVGIGSGLSHSLNSFLKQLGAPARDIYSFDEIDAIVTMKSGSFEVHNLNAAGADFKISGEFTRFKDKKVDYDMEIKINKQVLGTQEGQRSQLLLDEDAQGWYSVKLSAKGDLRKPSSVFFSAGGVKLEVKSAPPPSDKK
jgi:hypothetical protein